MKKVLSLLVMLFAVLSLAACNTNDLEKTPVETEKEETENKPTPEEEIELKKEIKLITPYGTPYLAIGGLIGTENLTIEAVNGPANLQTALVSGSHDIVIAPVNLGSKLYNAGKSAYQMAAVLTMNNAYIVTKAENKLDGLSDLSGQKVLAFGQTGIPGSLLTKLYTDNSNLNINDVDFTQASSAAVYSLFAGGSSDAKYALMSEPEISKLVLNDKIEVKTLDLCELLGIEVAQACVYINLNSENIEDVNKVLALISNNIKSLNENPTAYADKVIPLDRTFEAMGKEIIVRSIPLTNIVYKNAKDSKAEITTILSLLGVASPKDEFYYQG